MKEADHRAFAFIPGLDRLGGRQELHVALLACEIVRGLVGKPDTVLLPRADDEALCSPLIDVLGFSQRQHMRCAVDGLGQLFLAFLHLPTQADEHVMGEARPFNGDRTKGGGINRGLHRAAPAHLISVAVSRACVLASLSPAPRTNSFIRADQNRLRNYPAGPTKWALMRG